MEIKQLITFLSITQAGSFVQAGALLGYSQPTISSHIKALEEELHVKLFDRLGHKVCLSHEGKLLFPYAQRIVTTAKEATDILQGNGEFGGKIVIGANESLGYVHLPAILNHFKVHYPHITTRIKFDSVANILEMLKNNAVDIAFLLSGRITVPELISHILGSEEIVVVAAPNHPFTHFEEIDITHFHHEDLVVTEPGCTYRAMIDAILAQNQVRPKNLTEINNIQAIKQLVMNGYGVTILPKATVAEEIQKNLLLEIPWRGPKFEIYTQIVYHKDKWLSPAIRAFIEQNTAKNIC
ncbi:transcription regulator hth lysr [Lucifera butyrica]|uniref:Transcription regulator hth lysr n=1 Tax=Lucifera butyrica TaxID=1351585 RepID=A0A498R6X3_9FIRM|nr:LysR family transcriptional regulator [Lucifera butyrica]VBB07244.1 transcription regulator hth lysr [Lucifera butyrica]